MMNCGFCGTVNAGEEERCGRCGRRLTPVRPVPRDFPAGPVAVALKARYEVRVNPPLAERPAARQGALFPPSEKLRVVPIFGPADSPASVGDKPAAASSLSADLVHALRPGRPKPASRSNPSRNPGEEPQQRLAFVSAAPVNRACAPVADFEIYCNAPVAHSQHRLLAGAVDFGIILSALGVVAAIFLLAGGPWEPTPLNFAAMAVVSVMITVVYQLFWVLSNGDSAGLRLANLELVNFDGQRPDRRERLTRMLASWLSLLPGGLGLLWSLVDEETLTWHDHISKTFPTPSAHKSRMPLRP